MARSAILSISASLLKSASITRMSSFLLFPLS
jgi:hypothetical protein